MIDLALFRRPIFAAALCVNIAGVFAAFGSFLFITQYLQLVLGMGPLEAGLWLIPSGLVFMAGSLAAPSSCAGINRRPCSPWAFSSRRSATRC